MTSSLGNSVQELSGLGLGGEVARGPGERGDARAVAARAVQAQWRAGRLGRSGAARLEHGGVGVRWPAQGRGGTARKGHGGARLATRGGARGGGAG